MSFYAEIDNDIFYTVNTFSEVKPTESILSIYYIYFIDPESMKSKIDLSEIWTVTTEAVNYLKNYNERWMLPRSAFSSFSGIDKIQ